VPELLTDQVVRWLMTPAVMEDFPSLEDLTNRPAWMKRAQCRGEDPALFFPVLGASTVRAKAICAGCPVRSECLEHATREADTAGIWAGTSPRERRRRRAVA
jgi:WhiB family redox-sensing transcriptional regulator